MDRKRKSLSINREVKGDRHPLYVEFADCVVHFFINEEENEFCTNRTILKNEQEEGVEL